MSANSHPGHPGHPATGSTDTSIASPSDWRPTSSTFSLGSDETGESSTSASQRDSWATSDGVGEPADGEQSVESRARAKKGAERHRSHRSRNSGGFLLANAYLESPGATAQHSFQQPARSLETRGNAVQQSQDKRHHKKRSDTGLGLGLGRSPLAATVVTADSDVAVEGGKPAESQVRDNATEQPPRPETVKLDADSAQIVQLALNLSESRRNAARRITSTPIPLSSTLGDGFAGGSLRQHLQQQRRVSRNISPKPQKQDRSAGSSSRVASGQVNSPLQAAFEVSNNGPYEYHFTDSTLARAQKARTQIELMAQYRRLLQYVPPLAPHSTKNTPYTKTSLDAPLTSTKTMSRYASELNAGHQKLGRPYNPLQYIRNRKVRARERKAIDGEAQGFGDLTKVTSWIDQISEKASNLKNQDTSDESLSSYFTPIDSASSLFTSPQTLSGKSPAQTPKVKRPRVDWTTNPADMLADLFWLEQEDNKRSIEDRAGQKIIPTIHDTHRPVSRREPEVSHSYQSPNSRREKSPDLRIDTKFPDFTSTRLGAERHLDSATSRVREKIREATRGHHSHKNSVNTGQVGTRYRLKSHSFGQDDLWQERARSEPANDVLESQLREMVAKEANEDATDLVSAGKAGAFGQTVEENASDFTDGVVKSRSSTEEHNIPTSFSGIKEETAQKQFGQTESSGRPSLDVPIAGARMSLDDLDSTAPNSPQAQASRLSNAHIPSIAMDLSPPPRTASPPRHNLLKVKSKINPFERSRTRSRGRAATVENSEFGASWRGDSPDGPEKRRKSTSPAKGTRSRNADDDGKTSRRGSVRKGKSGDEASGIRGLFKGTRGPVARVSDFIWKKESPNTGTSSGFSTDESDFEEVRASQTRQGDDLDKDAAGPSDEENAKEVPSYLSNMPVFISPFQRRGRPEETISNEVNVTKERQAREQRRKISRANLLDAPPRIDVSNASPSSSPELVPDRSNRDSSVSDFESRRGSFGARVHGADARLNAILGMPGHRNANLPVTGLSGLQTSHDLRPSLDGKRQWSISDRRTSVQRGPTTKREIARTRALLLSSGVKAKEILRRAAEIRDLETGGTIHFEILALDRGKIKPVQRSQEHNLLAGILSDDIQLSKEIWQNSADVFCNTTIQGLIENIESLQSRIVDSLTPMVRAAADDADEVSKDLVTSQTLKVKRVIDTMDKMQRRRRRRLRWLRRGGWVMVEWTLVGVMWCVWFLVVIVRVVLGIGRGIVGTTRWLLWM